MSITTRSARPSKGRRLALSVQYAYPREGFPAPADFRRWAAAAARGEGVVTLRIVGEEEGRRLNKEFRGKDQATNVLSFAYGEGFDPEQKGFVGDIVLCAPVLAREADEQGKPLAAHCAHLTVHGVLHLQGYDHGTGDEARVMEALERFIVQRLGFADPYGDR
jgi:probable rRNA maturation factor